MRIWELSLICVPAGSYLFAVVALAVVAATTLLVGRERPAAEITGKREAYLDNAKFLASVLVVTGHLASMIESSGKEEHSRVLGPSTAVQKALFFHMPLFCLASGAACSGALSGRRLERLAVSTAGPVVVGTGLLAVIANIDVFKFLFNVAQIDPLWYLRCLLVWRLTSPLLEVFRREMQAVIALAIGTMVAYTDEDREGSLSVHAGFFLPYFVLGRLLDWDRLLSLAPQALPKRPLFGWAAFLAFVGLYISNELALDRLFLSLEAWPDLGSGLRPLLAPDCPADALFLWARYVAGLGLRGGMALLFLVWCVPHRPVFFTQNGSRTLYVYCLHVPALLLCIAPFKELALSSSWDQGGTRSLELCIRGQLMAAKWLLFSFALTYVLSSRYCCSLFQIVVEPSWILCRCRWGRQKQE
mmetsp:Transcript_110214/g.322559  ORF Transcript_110214/g.322559 Transcript_110214/m.322559 type:complete len:415 (-) Transcript_110214:50-1294(-)